MTPLGTLGMNAANEGIGAIMGIALGGINDERQRKQQEKLHEIQMKGQKEMMDYSTMKQMQMWHATNYGEQIKELKNAGLNPGLLYGMSGGGGTTTGSPSGSTTGGTAPSGGGEALAMAGMGLQNAMSLRLMKAQEEVLTTQAEKNKAEATKTSGVDTTETKTRIDSLLQGIDNARQQYEIQKLDITLKNIENFEKQASQSDRLDYIEYQTKIALKQLDNVTSEAFINKATIKQKIDIIKQEAIQAILKNELTQHQIQLTDQQRKSLAEQILLNWDKLSVDKQETEIHRQLKDYNTDPTTDMVKSLLHSLNTIMHLQH